MLCLWIESLAESVYLNYYAMTIPLINPPSAPQAFISARADFSITDSASSCIKKMPVGMARNVGHPHRSQFNDGVLTDPCPTFLLPESECALRALMARLFAEQTNTYYSERQANERLPVSK